MSGVAARGESPRGELLRGEQAGGFAAGVTEGGFPGRTAAVNLDGTESLRSNFERAALSGGVTGKALREQTAPSPAGLRLGVEDGQRPQREKTSSWCRGRVPGLGVLGRLVLNRETCAGVSPPRILLG